MDKVSDEIRAKLEKFGTDKPEDSRPFFVSMRAYEYSGIADKVLPNLPPPNTTSR